MTRGEVARVAAGIRALGVDRSARAVAAVPIIPDAVVAFLATASIGAVWSRCSRDSGDRGVVDRFAWTDLKVLIAVDGDRCRGKDFDRREADPLRRDLGAERTVLVGERQP